MLVVVAWVIISVLLPALVPDGKSAKAAPDSSAAPVTQQMMPENGAPSLPEGGSGGETVPVRPLKG
jgi:hypothetical protein